MRELTIELHAAAPDKPTVGQPCNGCGICCVLATCPLGRLRFLRRRGPCPALIWAPDDQRYICGLLAAPQHYFFLPQIAAPLARQLTARWIAADTGCDCSAEIQT